MRLAVFNGSPRAKGSNTRRIMEHFLDGYQLQEGNSRDGYYLTSQRDFAGSVDAFCRADVVILAFPLYTDCMPAVVKEFIEALAALRNRSGNPPLGFIVHSGFPESFHSHAVRKYLEKLCRRLGSEYIGCAIAGGSEATRSQPEGMNSRFFRRFHRLGETFGRTGKFDRRVMEQMARPVRFSPVGRLTARLWCKMGDMFYWEKMLKENRAFEHRHDMPYMRR